MNDSQPKTIRLHPNDNVIVARIDLLPGILLPDASTNSGIMTRAAIPAGHKIATAGIEKGAPVRKYNQIIGFAGDDITPGDHVHVDNLEFAEFERDYNFCADVQPTEMIPEHERATFQGFRRADGRAATRNYIGILTTVNCSATVARSIADHFRGPALDAYPNIDGVVALTHGWGCGMGSPKGQEQVRKAVGGYARHPNFAGLVIVGLGCEGLQMSQLLEVEGLAESDNFRPLIIQDVGAAATMRAGIAAVQDMLPPKGPS